MPTRILLAESDDVLRAGLAEQLAHEGYDVVTAADAQAVRDAVREPLNFAIIGLDDGEQLAASLRGQGLSCPVLLLTDGEVATAGESLAPMVAEELQRSGRFEVVLVTPERLSGLTGQRELAMEQVIPTNTLTRLRDAFACEAVLFTRVTQYRPYPPPAVGWRMKLVECTTQASVWAADEVFDSGETAVQNAARRYESGRSGAAPALADSRSILGSPSRFARYSLSALFGTLPSR